ncbi:hypothetical protein [Paenibacillus taiwanensis]|uniref:hypothetical protein n=1 Tax=Paenibacillus taiwanensis TaxID=401638 RepID=UPI00048D370E|nr:hypothetical protein [Paenibacillus taiwanensis]
MLLVDAAPAKAESDQGQQRMLQALSESTVQSKIQYQSIGYRNEIDGTLFYNVSVYDRTAASNLVIERAPDGTLMRWDDKIGGIYDSGQAAPGIILNPKARNDMSPFVHFYYEVKDGTIHKGQAYEDSPSGRWALTNHDFWRPVLSTNGSGYSRLKSYWLKDQISGEVAEWYTSTLYTKAVWMPDNRLLVNRYSENRKQNEISIYNPATAQWSYVLNGTMRGYRAAEGKMLYVQNEPQRLEWVYDFQTQMSHLLTDEAERALFTDQKWKQLEQAPELDKDLDIAALPLKTVAITKDMEHVVHIGGKEIEVPFTYKRGGTLWIPVKPLADAMGWKVEAENVLASQYRYGIRADKHRVELTPDNSQVLNERLYMTRGQLTSLGYPGVTVSPKRQMK